MRSNSKSTYFRTFIMLSFFLLILTGCQKNDESFEILVFTGLPESSLDEMKGFTESELENTLDFNVRLYTPVVERLILEIVNHSGDILIMERDLLAAAYDSKELYQLDELRNLENTIELTSFELEALLADGEITEEVDVYANALRVINFETYFEESKPIELVAIIPKYTVNKEAAFSILEKLVQN